MKRNVLEYLEDAAAGSPQKTAFTDGENTQSFLQLHSQARSAGSFLCDKYRNRPILVLMERGPEMIAAFFSVLYSGNFYIPAEEEMSLGRIAGIIEKTGPAAILCDETTEKAATSLGFPGDIYRYSGIAFGDADAAALAEIRESTLDVDPAYIVFTSGSTGSPKGVVGCHRNMIDYMEALDRVVRASGDTVFGMQAPLYVDACLKEILLTIKTGASTVLIPKRLFLFPARLVAFMNAHQVNAVCWAVSALAMISSLGALETAVPKLDAVFFGGEVFPVAQLELWRRALPDARFVNLYGPTECTGMSCYYEVQKDASLPGGVPIGRAFSNTGVFLFGGNGLITEPEVPGELYIRGTCVTLGYFRDPERTAEAFVQSPLQSDYPETVYRTGDLAKYNAGGDLVYIGRKDHQIKHMGHRIEPAEIEAAAARLGGVLACCCVFDKGRDRIVLYYTGLAEEKALPAYLHKALPQYMQPHACVCLKQLPHTANGKPDRALMAKWAREL